MINILKHNNSGTALLMAILILAGVLVVTLSAASIIVTGLKMGRTQMQATKAYFATEAGVERALWAARADNGFDYSSCPASGECAVDFDAIPAFCNTVDCQTNIDYILSNNSAYNVSYTSVTEGIRFRAVGEYADTARSVIINFQYLHGAKEQQCLPNCTGRDCGDDGCGGTCGSLAGACPSTATACSTYSDPGACTGHGCSWSAGSSGNTTNSGFDAGITDWSGNAWGDDVLKSAQWKNNNGNPGGFAEIKLDKNNANLSGGGYFEQAITVTSGSITSATLDLDYYLNKHDGATPVSFGMYVFVDTSSGAPTIGTEVWSIDPGGTVAWTSISQVDLTSVISSAGTYYVKMGIFADFPNDNNAKYEGGYDNIIVNWAKAGSCSGFSSSFCVGGVCMTACWPNCDGRECGDDGCGGTCDPGCEQSEHCFQGQCLGT